MNGDGLLRLRPVQERTSSGLPGRKTWRYHAMIYSIWLGYADKSDENRIAAGGAM